MKKPERIPRPEAVLSLTINGHTLTGAKHRGRWRFGCPSWPDVAAMDDVSAAVQVFTTRALAEATTRE